MIKNSKFSYSEDGVTIIFLELPKKENTRETHYEFEVSDDPVLTKKLKASVKKSWVPFSSIRVCAKALFAIIKNNAFEELMSREDRSELFQDYLQAFGKPDFQIDKKKKDLEGIPKWEVTLLHGGGENCTATSRTVDNAKGLALKQFFSKNPQ